MRAGCADGLHRRVNFGRFPQTEDQALLQVCGIRNVDSLRVIFLVLSMGKGRKGRNGTDSCRIPFHLYNRQAIAGGVLSIVATPAAMSPRAAVEADAWAHFRIASLKFRLHPTGGITNDQSAGFVGGIQDTPPTTIAQVSELLPSVVLGGDTTTPTEWCSVPKSDLAGPLPWYKSVAGTTDPTEESPGALIVVGTGTDVFGLEYKGVFEFKTSVATANTPMQRKLHAQLREERVAGELARQRELLLRLLSSPTGPTALVAVPAAARP